MLAKKYCIVSYITISFIEYMLQLYMFRYTLNVVFKRRSMPLKQFPNVPQQTFTHGWTGSILILLSD